MDERLSTRPDDIDLRLYSVLTAMLVTDVDSAFALIQSLNLADPSADRLLFNQWDAEAGYLHAVTVANVFIESEMNDDASKLLGEASDFVSEIRRRGINSPGIDYLEATILNLQKDTGGALVALNRSIDRGWRSARWVEIDPNLKLLHREERFVAALQDMESRIDSERQAVRGQATHAFDSNED